MKERLGTGDIEGLCCNRYIYNIYNMYNMYMVYMYNNKFELVWLCLSILVIKEGWITAPMYQNPLAHYALLCIRLLYPDHLWTKRKKEERSRLFSSSYFFFLHSSCNNVFLNLTMCSSIWSNDSYGKKREKTRLYIISIYTNARENIYASLLTFRIYK